MNPPFTPNIPSDKTYAQALEELQTIVQAIEDETVGIDELAEKVKTASALVQFCRQKLRSTEEDIANTLENNLLK
ncbi:MAG TPA: exodeoxyribonuclease VII small subunit [Chitinophagales bacterium]|nr:exodeoxyribonuclease VII small subunit [Chitinophagales bacterium]HRK27326.1 exodeoxyribonuclease VII small subunit [Chitinophagales bacterium]